LKPLLVLQYKLQQKRTKIKSEWLETVFQTKNEKESIFINETHDNNVRIAVLVNQFKRNMMIMVNHREITMIAPMHALHMKD
jgi:hypothetical protein